VLHRAAKQLVRVHDDLYGPVTPTTPSGDTYFLILVDDYSRFMWTALLPTKVCVAAAIKRI
jgi:Zn-dependent M28 family amino/carboxypeptidase